MFARSPRAGSACNSTNIQQTCTTLGGAGNYTLEAIGAKCCGANAAQAAEWNAVIGRLQQTAPAVATIIADNVKAGLHAGKSAEFLLNTGAWAVNLHMNSDGSRILTIQTPLLPPAS